MAEILNLEKLVSLRTYETCAYSHVHVDLTLADSTCARSICSHRFARNWVGCQVCCQWFHCMCVGVKATTAKMESFEFVCSDCFYFSSDLTALKLAEYCT